jgi:hypothetical protein
MDHQKERKVYLVLTDTGTIFTRLIRLYTKQTYNHSSLSLDLQLENLYSFGRKQPWNPFIGGFVKEQIGEGLFKKATCEIYCLNITEEQFQHIQQQIQQFEDKQHEYKYNLLGLFALMFRKPLDRENAFFCSEFVSTLLTRSRAVAFNKPTCFVTPSDLGQLEDVEYIYQGSIRDYSHTPTKKVLIPILLNG